MIKLNKNSDLYYISKSVSFKPLNISKVHLIDDDCNEVIATVVGARFIRGWHKPSDIKLLDYEEYTTEKWDEMVDFIEYERAEVR